MKKRACQGPKLSCHGLYFYGTCSGNSTYSYSLVDEVDHSLGRQTNSLSIQHMK